jgi:hypothetical protein
VQDIVWQKYSTKIAKQYSPDPAAGKSFHKTLTKIN